MSSEALEQLCMENTQILPWIWVVETLVSSKSVNTSILMQLAKIIPDKFGKMGKNEREAVSLKILEGLAARDIEDNDGISDTGERIKIKFDPSESYEDVLKHLLARASDVENGGLKMLKWDVQSFIAGKRACLNSSFLLKLKDAILEGSHPVLESLKERSGITVGTPYNNYISPKGAHFDELMLRYEDSESSEENVPNTNFLPAKRNRSHVTAKNLERQSCDPEREAAKKHKQGEDCQRHDSNMGVTITPSQHVKPVKPSENLVIKVEKEVDRSDKEVKVEDNEFVASQNNIEDQEAVMDMNDKIGELITSHDTLLPDVEVLNTVDEAVKFNNDQDPEATGNSDDYHDEESDLNKRKAAFLSSQCPFSQDSLATQLKLCIKCNNGGKLLVCSSDACPIMFHESCLGSTVNLDIENRFYCPSCAYSRAILEYLEVQKIATLARKNLAIFINQKAGSPNESASRVEAPCDPVQTYEDESDQSVASTYSQRSTRTPNLRSIYEGVPQTRNKVKLAWTNAEVEKLKEGVEKFSSSDGVIPWTKILEFGDGVFHESRGKINLKHKWKAMNKSVTKFM